MASLLHTTRKLFTWQNYKRVGVVGASGTFAVNAWHGNTLCPGNSKLFVVFLFLKSAWHGVFWPNIPFELYDNRQHFCILTSRFRIHYRVFRDDRDLVVVAKDDGLPPVVAKVKQLVADLWAEFGAAPPVA